MRDSHLFTQKSCARRSVCVVSVETSDMKAVRMVPSLLLVLFLLVLMQSGALCARRFRGGRNPQPRRSPPPPTHRADRGDTTESFPLDFTAVEENMDNFMTQVKNLAQSLYPCSAQKLDHDMKLNFLVNTSVTCNDGSPAGYVAIHSRAQTPMWSNLGSGSPELLLFCLTGASSAPGHLQSVASDLRKKVLFQKLTFGT